MAELVGPPTNLSGSEVGAQGVTLRGGKQPAKVFWEHVVGYNELVLLVELCYPQRPRSILLEPVQQCAGYIRLQRARDDAISKRLLLRLLGE